MSVIKTLLIADFDETLFHTFSPPKGGIGVSEACERAVLELFGDQGYHDYLACGGLRNRAPIELVTDLIKTRAQHMCAGLAYLETHWKELQELEGTTELTEDLNGLAEAFVRRKLELLLGQISERWPVPVSGADECLRRFGRRYDILLGIVSSGHRRVIQRILRYHHIFVPHLVTADEGQQYALRPKPAPDYFERLKQGIPGGIPERVIYAGDDPDKDGRFAEAIGAEFVLVGGPSGTSWSRIMRMV